jgi:anti-sigma factor RsiW
MSGLEERIERLIVRKIDGMLTQDEELELDRILIRSPEARQVYEEYRRIDDLAAQSLASLFPESGKAGIGGVPPIPRPVEASSHLARRYHRAWWALTGLAAACLAALLYLNPSHQGPARPIAGTGLGSAGADSRGGNVGGSTSGFKKSSPVVPVGFPGGVTDRHVDHEWIGVRDNDGNIYWLEVTRTRTSTRPGSGPGFKLANSDL